MGNKGGYLGIPDSKIVHLPMPGVIVDLIDEMAKRQYTSRSAIVRQFILDGVRRSVEPRNRDASQSG